MYLFIRIECKIIRVWDSESALPPEHNLSLWIVFSRRIAKCYSWILCYKSLWSLKIT